MSEYRFAALASLGRLAPMRAARMETLTALPGLFVEQAVRRSRVHAIECDEPIGYLTVLQGTLTELFVTAEHRTHVDGVLEQAIPSLGLRHAWMNTFDPIALAACTTRSRPYEVVGFHFGHLQAVALAPRVPRPAERIATLADIDLVREANHPDVFDLPEDIPVWLENGWVTLFELLDGLAGFGLSTPVGAHTVACDVGIRVCPPYQRRGLGAWIVQRMALRAKDQGLVPIAGCASDNAVSRRTLERAGFVADHRLLQFAL
jgi:GNAT superfamily N-acetyltransferase